MKIVACLLFAVSATFLFAAPQSAAEKELLGLESEWYTAYLHSDASTMNRIEGEDMIVIVPMITQNQLTPMRKGRSFERRPDAVKSQMARVKRSLDQTQVRIIGDVAIINGIQTSIFSGSGGEQRAEREYYTSVWAKRKGTWQVVNAQWTHMEIAPTTEAK